MRHSDNLARRARAITVPACLTAERSVLDQAIATCHDLVAAADDGMCGDIDFVVEAAHRKLAEIKAQVARMRRRLN